MDRKNQLDGRGADRFVEQLVDRGLPFQLAAMIRVHFSTLCVSRAAQTQ